jgi:hypothetical protein
MLEKPKYELIKYSSEAHALEKQALLLLDRATL